VEESLRRRIERLDELIAKLGPIRKHMSPVISTGGDYLLRHLDRQRRLDRAWLKELLADVTARKVRDVPDPGALGRAAHDDTGSGANRRTGSGSRAKRKK
jgi:hypothetical protein